MASKINPRKVQESEKAIGTFADAEGRIYLVAPSKKQ